MVLTDQIGAASSGYGSRACEPVPPQRGELVRKMYNGVRLPAFDTAGRTGFPLRSMSKRGDCRPDEGPPVPSSRTGKTPSVSQDRRKDRDQVEHRKRQTPDFQHRQIRPWLSAALHVESQETAAGVQSQPRQATERRAIHFRFAHDCVTVGRPLFCGLTRERGKDAFHSVPKQQPGTCRARLGFASCCQMS